MRHLDEGRLQAWLDGDRGDLTPAERAEVDAHVARCPDCAGRLEELRRLSGTVSDLLATDAALPVEIPPFDAVARRAGETRASRRRRATWLAGAWAASVVAALGVGWGAGELWRGGPVPPETPAVAGGEMPPPPPAADVAEEEPAPERAESAEERAEPSPVLARTRVVDAAPSGTPPGDAPAPDRVAAAAEPNPATPRTTPSPEAGVLRGRVTDLAGNPLPATQIWVEGTGRGTLTDDDGSYVLDLRGLPDSAVESVTVTALRLGYEEGNRSVSLRPGDAVSADFELPQQAIALEEVVVTAESAETNRVVLGSAIAPLTATSDGSLRWRPATLEEAEAQAGFRPLTVPDLDILRVELSAPGGDPWVRIVQRLPEGGTLDLVESRDESLEDRLEAPAGASLLAVRRAGVVIVGAAPLPPRDLEDLLASIR